MNGPFAVFGMTKSKAREIADKKIWAKCKKSGKPVTQPEFEAMVSELADEIYQSKDTVIVSDRFDAPQFCKDFIGLCRASEARSLHIKAYTPQEEKTKSGRTRYRWESYQD